MWSNIANSPSKTVATPSIKQESTWRNIEPSQQENNDDNESIQSNGHSTLERTTTLISGPGGSPLMRYKHAICSSPGGFIYIHGGRFGNLALEDDVWRFDAHQNSWLQLETWGSAKPTNLQEHTLIEFNEQLYLFGGQVSASNQEDSFWRLDLATNEWRSLSMRTSKRFGTYLGPTNRRGHSAVTYKSSMFIFGGYEDFRGSSAQLWQYDLLEQRWELANLSSSAACHPEPRHSHSAIVHADSMYIYGGLSDLKPLSDLWRWSWRDRRWFKERTRGQSPGQLHGHTAIQAFGSMFVFGGERRHGRPTRSLWRLNLANLSWQKIRPKGPRPSATTWHAAIANPLNILDEANYIIEGAEEDAKLLLAHPATSVGCLHDDQLRQPADQEPVQLDDFSHANNNNNNHVRPMNIINSENLEQLETQRVNDNSHERSKLPPKSSSMTLNSSLKFNSTRSSSGKRRLGLSFLRRKNNNRSASIIPSSLSAANLINTFNQTKQTQQATEETAQRHSIAIIQTPQRNSDQVYVDSPQANNSRILDSLDTDIKQMFQEALKEEEEGQSSSAPGGDTKHDSTRYSLTTNSQLSQTTYQTARDHLTRSNTINTNNSTLTLTNGVSTTLSQASGRAHQQQPTSASGVLRREHNGPRNPRPKSEIVQSLIDRADARIKHLYTPFFNTNNGHHHHHHHHHNHHHHNQHHSKQQSAFDSNDPLLGKLQNHRMFDRSSAGRDRRRESRHSLDKSKRHTIHQTMTYYNLYFSEDKNGLQSPTVSINGNSNSNAHEEHQTTTTTTTTTGNRRLERDDLSSSTIKGATTSCSSGAALVGVRDGTHSSHSTSGSQMDQLSSLAATIQNSSESRTICGSRDVLVTEANVGEEENRDCDLLLARGEHQQQQMNARDTTTTSESGDNTSMSFSVIAEFEEDDMLQYSSPTDPKINVHDERCQQVGRDQMMQVENGDDDDDDDDDDDEYEQDDDDYLNGQSFERQNSTRQTVCNERQQVAAHKSASSGYDSIHSSYEHNRRHRRLVNGHSDAHEDSSVPSESSMGEPSPIRNNQPDNQSKHIGLLQLEANLRPADQSHKTMTTTASSTTTDSLALTSSDAFDSSMSHCYQVAQSTSTQQQQQQQQQQQPMPSKSLPSSPPEKPHKQSMKLSRENTTASSDATIAHQQLQTKPLLAANQCQRLPFVARSARFFSKKKSKTRYWQLCMFVIGGKQSGAGHGTNEPISMWRLYI